MVLMAGTGGSLADAFARACSARGLAHVLTGLDTADAAAVADAFARHRPAAVVNVAGYARVDDAEHDVAACQRENTLGPQVLASACARTGVPFVTFSSDLVFDGATHRPYVESDWPSPLNTWGRSKAEAEALVLAAHPAALVVRTGAMFGMPGTGDFVGHTLAALRLGAQVMVSNDQLMAPTYVPHLATATLDLLRSGERGIWHLASAASLTREQLAIALAHRVGLPASRVLGAPAATLFSARRPLYSVLGTSRGRPLPPLSAALDHYFAVLSGAREVAA